MPRECNPYSLSRAEAKRLIQWLMDEYGFPSYAQLGRSLNITEPDLSKFMNGKLLMGPTSLLKIHEYTNKSVKELRKIANIENEN